MKSKNKIIGKLVALALTTLTTTAFADRKVNLTFNRDTGNNYSADCTHEQYTEEIEEYIAQGEPRREIQDPDFLKTYLGTKAIVDIEEDAEGLAWALMINCVNGYYTNNELLNPKEALPKLTWTKSANRKVSGFLTKYIEAKNKQTYKKNKTSIQQMLEGSVGDLQIKKGTGIQAPGQFDSTVGFEAASDRGPSFKFTHTFKTEKPVDNFKIACELVDTEKTIGVWSKLYIAITKATAAMTYRGDFVKDSGEQGYTESTELTAAIKKEIDKIDELKNTKKASEKAFTDDIWGFFGDNVKDFHTFMDALWLEVKKETAGGVRLTTTGATPDILGD